MYVYIYVYIYIYIYVRWQNVRRRIDSLWLRLQVSGQKITHQKSHKSEIPLENTSDNPWDSSSKIHWESDNPLENAADNPR